jgi:DNA-binding CsgD family transcriptional regulator/tetratricopeptide (TPR) repeat protein
VSGPVRPLRCAFPLSHVHEATGHGCLSRGRSIRLRFGLKVPGGTTSPPAAARIFILPVRSVRRINGTAGSPPGTDLQLFSCDVTLPAPVRPLLGRDPELSRLAGWVREVAAGRGRAVLVESEPGIGKSALVRAACAGAGGLGCQLFWGAGDELGQQLPLLPLTYGLQVRENAADTRRAVIAGLLRGEGKPEKGVDLSAAAAEHLLALVEELCASAPTVLVIDDLQWADDMTVALWRRLAQSVRQLPLLLVGVMRPVPRRDSLLALRVAVPAGDRVRLARLPEHAVAELVAILAGGNPAPGLLRLADDAVGNPLYLTELVDALARSDRLAINDAGVAELLGGPTPTSLSEAIADRLGFLTRWVREMLRVAALLGVDFSVDDLAIVSGKTVSELLPALEEARAAGVLTESGHYLAFRHPLIRASLYEQMPAPVRAAWHRDAARALVEAGAPVDRVARQLLPAVCGPSTDGEVTEPVDEWALTWLVDNAPLLTGQAPRMAIELLRRASLNAPGGPRQHDLLACRLAEALFRAGDVAEAEQVASGALDQVADEDLLVDLHWTLVQCRMTIAGRAQESLDALSQALAGPGLGPRQRARLLVLTARTHRHLGDVDAAERFAAVALAAGREIHDDRTVGWALQVLALVAMTREEMDEALRLFDQALPVARTDPALTDLGLLLLLNKAVTLSELDRHDEAFVAAREVQHLADRTGNVLRLTQAHATLGRHLLATGQWDDALVEVDVMPEELKGASVGCSDQGVAAVICFHRGEAARARRHLAAGAPYASRLVESVVAWPYTLARILDLELTGAREEALEVLAGTVDKDDADVSPLLVDAVRLAIEIGDAALAAAAAARVKVFADRTATPHWHSAVLFSRGLLDRDPAMLLQSAERYQEAGLPLPRAQALEAAAAAFADVGDRSSMQAALTRAQDGYLLLNAAWDVARLRSRFRAFGIRRSPRIPHRRPAHGWGSLTPTEVKIAALVAEGMSNPKIATQLFLSSRTVSTHVSHILTKLDVHSRVDIAREAGRRYVTS